MIEKEQKNIIVKLYEVLNNIFVIYPTAEALFFSEGAANVLSSVPKVTDVKDGKFTFAKIKKSSVISTYSKYAFKYLDGKLLIKNIEKTGIIYPAFREEIIESIPGFYEDMKLYEKDNRIYCIDYEGTCIDFNAFYFFFYGYNCHIIPRNKEEENYLNSNENFLRSLKK